MISDRKPSKKEACKHTTIKRWLWNSLYREYVNARYAKA